MRLCSGRELCEGVVSDWLEDELQSTVRGGSEQPEDSGIVAEMWQRMREIEHYPDRERDKQIMLVDRR